MTDFNISMSSADPEELMRYEKLSDGLNRRLDYEARQLSAALRTFASTCTEYSTGIGPQLADDLQKYVQRIDLVDQWVGQVRLGFQYADQPGDVGLSFEEASALGVPYKGQRGAAGSALAFANAAELAKDIDAAYGINNYDRCDQALQFIYGEMVNNAHSDIVQAIKLNLEQASHPSWYIPAAGNPAGYVVGALAMLYEKVRPNGPWDHKKALRERLHLVGDDYFPLRGDPDHEYNFDIWSNIHYGYVGSAAGFSPETLQRGHQGKLAPGFDTGITDPGDVIAVQIGIDLWHKYGDKVTPEQILQEILAHRDEFAAGDDPKAIKPRNRR